MKVSDQPAESQASFSEDFQSPRILADLHETLNSTTVTLESSFQQPTRPYQQFCDDGYENSLSTDKILQPIFKPQNELYSADNFSQRKSKCTI